MFRETGALGVSLREAVDHYALYLEKAGKSMKLQAFCLDFLANKQQDGASRRYLNDLKSKLGRFSDHFGERLICDITNQELDAWLRSLHVNVTSRDAYRRNIGVLFELARQRGYCAQNPAAAIQFKHQLKGEVTILSADQVSLLLRKCVAELVPYIVIAPLQFADNPCARLAVFVNAEMFAVRLILDYYVLAVGVKF